MTIPNPKSKIHNPQSVVIGLGEILWDLLPAGKQFNEQANRVASYVCSRSGATPPMPPVTTW